MPRFGGSAFGVLILTAIAGCSGETPLGPTAVTLEATTGSSSMPALGLPLSLSVADPSGDNTGAIDVLEFEMAFDPASGDYEIVLTASAAAPFDGDFRVNINLLNVDASSFFQDVLNDFSLTSSTTTLLLDGTSPLLTSWDEGHRVHTNNLGGSPPFGLFRSSVGGLPRTFLTNEDYIAFHDDAVPATVVSSGAPAPPACALVDEVQHLLDGFVNGGKIDAAGASVLQSSLDVACKALENGRRRRAYRMLGQFIDDLKTLWNAGAITTTHDDAEALRDAAVRAMMELRGEV